MATFSTLSAGIRESPTGRGFSAIRQDKDYAIILPHFHSSITTLNKVFLHYDVKGQPYPVEDFREEMPGLGISLDAEGLGSYQISHAWILTLRNIAAKRTPGCESNFASMGTVPSYRS